MADVDAALVFFPTDVFDTAGPAGIDVDAGLVPFVANDEGGEPPTVTVVSPLPGAELGPSDVVTIEVTDALGFGTRPGRVYVVTPYATEVVWDSGFRAPYSGSFTTIPNGYRLTMTRSGGWPTPIRFDAIFTDRQGNEA